MTADLSRFVEAQARTYEQALGELHRGAKQSHWMWFVFPQIAGLGRSETARRFSIRDVDEARSYLAHPVLGQRLRDATEAVARWAGRRSLETILGPVDALKFVSSMTLFEAAATDAVSRAMFARALEAFAGGRRDPQTLALLASAH